MKQSLLNIESKKYDSQQCSATILRLKPSSAPALVVSCHRNGKMRYKSSNTEFILAFLIALPAFTIFLGALTILYKHDFHVFSLKNYSIYSVTYFSLAFFIWKNTYYMIGSSVLQIKNFGLLTKQIEINQITEIKKVDKKPATSTQPEMNVSGLTIQTKAKETLFVSPIREYSFLVELQRRNPRIKIADNTAANKS